MGRYDLHAIARQDVLLDGIDCTLIVALGKTGAEGRLSSLRTTQLQAPTRRNRLTQLFKQAFQALQAAFVCLFLRWVDQHNGVHLARQVIEHHHGIGNHQ
ncbi:hypothetical protein D3C77_610710 [compost metagenome]